ncbi:hypothetical protein [Acinetobacter tianfuensis]|uniref:Uncharacterized protein n=1 Tax=Acinetobacter tianfuensis TaxID=2419603 RepID=A0A3A8EI29_9GAMM|nr:hypothetical protein [Acinetobacter tianfuensis]RKG33768.1 hypothetical protein D7V32_02930 [Acinetobacter tianfuensis]
MNGIQAVIAVNEGKSVQYYDYEDNAWLSFDKKTGFRLGCLLGEPNHHGHIAKFRITPSFILINGIKVPAPLQEEPSSPINYWWFNPQKPNGIATGKWLDDHEDHAIFENIGIYLEESDVAQVRDAYRSNMRDLVND